VVLCNRNPNWLRHTLSPNSPLWRVIGQILGSGQKAKEKRPLYYLDQIPLCINLSNSPLTAGPCPHHLALPILNPTRRHFPSLLLSCTKRNPFSYLLSWGETMKKALGLWFRRQEFNPLLCVTLYKFFTSPNFLSAYMYMTHNSKGTKFVKPNTTPRSPAPNPRGNPC
jgi:hypothetical protein